MLVKYNLDQYLWPLKQMHIDMRVRNRQLSQHLLCMMQDKKGISDLAIKSPHQLIVVWLVSLQQPLLVLVTTSSAIHSTIQLQIDRPQKYKCLITGIWTSKTKVAHYDSHILNLVFVMWSNCNNDLFMLIIGISELRALNSPH